MNLKRIIAVFVLTLVAACATISGTQPPSFNEGLAIGLTTVTAIRTTATTLLNAKKISADDGDNVLKTTDAARTGLDVARKLSATDLKSAQGKLDAVRAVLTAQQAYLATKEK